ncbi:hypothetical protein C1646_786538 [Rhizophagus diaphanus]|nr:hypothetical protein C1646_786538 [Rhizophagus diaphanus] [Rhizophagus sp. MUCL 43196]
MRISASSFMEKTDVLKKEKADLFTENFDLKREVAKLKEELGNRIEELEKNRVDNDAENAELKTENLSKKKQNYVGEISETPRPKNPSIDEASQYLAYTYDKAIDAEDTAMKANQEEILCWTLYAQDFRVQLNEIIKNGKDKFGKKKARSLLYDSISKQLSILHRSQDLGLQLREISRDSLRKKTQRAEKFLDYSKR